VKFTQKGEVGFAVNAEPSTRGIRLLFTVSDSGIGMTAAETKRLFRPFTQAHEGIAKRFGGSGLGLSLVKRLAKAMGGDLKVESTPGRGSTFVLTVVVANSGG
jgi:signal transduction histidine kinase